jgi:tripartite ATP-independent transporter DctM subunit
MQSWINRLHRAEDALLVVLLSTMIVLAGTQIILRNFLDSGFVWIDPLLRVLVLWLGLLGATVATRNNKHIRIDLLSKLFDRNTHRLIQSLVDLHCDRLVWTELDQDGLCRWPGLFVGNTRLDAGSYRPGRVWIDWLALFYKISWLGAVVCSPFKACPETGTMSFAAPILLLLAILRTPLFVVIGLSAMLGFHSLDVDLSVISIEVYRLAEMPVLLAIPLFTFAGYLLGEGKASTRLVNLTNSLLGWMPGGLAIVAIFACALFTAFTGASGITIVALGGLLYPALKQAGYLDNFNLGLLTSSGSLGLLFAPSLPLILYGVVAQQMDLDQPVSITDLFLAGVFPGLLMLVMLALYSMMQPRDRSRREPFNRQVAIAAILDAKWEIPLPLLVLGGIYGGYFAVSEAAAVTAVYVLIVEVFIIREIKISGLPAIMRESMMLVGGIMIIVGVSLASTNYLIDAEVPTRLFAFIQSHIDEKLTFLILLNLFLLVLGMMLDIFSAIVIIVPIILPIAVGYGIHPVHLGIIFLANMQLGYFTPPVGMNLFIASYRFNKPVMTLYVATIPFFVVLLVAVLIITYWPTLSLVLLAD